MQWHSARVNKRRACSTCCRHAVLLVRDARPIDQDIPRAGAPREVPGRKHLVGGVTPRAFCRRGPYAIQDNEVRRHIAPGRSARPVTHPREEVRHGTGPVHHAVASAGAQPLRRAPVGPAGAALGRRAGLQRGLDRRAPHRALGAASVARTCSSPRRCCRPRASGSAPGGFLLPYHHPAELANRVAMLDHLAQGRFNFGVAASGLPSDWAMFNVDGMTGQQPGDDPRVARHHPRLWSEEPFDYKGKYWHVPRPDRCSRTPRARTSCRSRSRTRRSGSPG